MKKQNIDKLFSAAALQQARLLNDSLPAEEDLSKFAPSDKLNGQMRDLLSKAEKQRTLRKRRTVKYLASAAASIVVLAGVFVFTSYANGTNPFRIFERAFSITNVTSRIREENFNAHILSIISNVYLPTWVPEGYTATFANQSDTGNCIVNYSLNGNKAKFLLISQKETNVKALNDADVNGLKKIIVHNQAYYSGEKKRSNSIENDLVFLRDNRYFLFTSTLEEKDLVRVAESLELKR